MPNTDTAPRSTPTASNVPADALEVSPEAFTSGFGESILATLDLDTWSAGEDLGKLYGRIDAEVREAVEQENTIRKTIREKIFPRLAGYEGAPKNAGVYQASSEDIARVHRGLLLNGGVEACDGTHQVHDTLPLTIFQIGVGLVSYQGNQGTWGHRLFRRDLRVNGPDPTEEMLQLLEQRAQRGGLNQPSQKDSLSELARRGIMSYAERAILLRRSTAPWRMGHGNPAPYELITGSGSLDLMVEATKVVRSLVEGHQKFVFVASEPSDRMLLTIGQALRPLEYAIVSTFKEAIYKTVENGHYRMRTTVDTTWDGVTLNPEAWIKRFRDVVAPQIVVGVFRATPLAPAQVFYAHAEHAHVAAHVALADSVFQEHRGFPMLIDLADNVCRSVFGGDTLTGPVSNAYVEAGEPWRYLSERATRRS
jgi:hypothetical protein